jgi:hypothetical protein
MHEHKWAHLVLVLFTFYGAGAGSCAGSLIGD